MSPIGLLLLLTKLESDLKSYSSGSMHKTVVFALCPLLGFGQSCLLLC